MSKLTMVIERANNGLAAYGLVEEGAVCTSASTFHQLLINIEEAVSLYLENKETLSLADDIELRIDILSFMPSLRHVDLTFLSKSSKVSVKKTECLFIGKRLSYAGRSK